MDREREVEEDGGRMRGKEKERERERERETDKERQRQIEGEINRENIIGEKQREIICISNLHDAYLLRTISMHSLNPQPS